MDCFPPSRPVSAGAKLALIAPAGRFEREAFDAGVAWLRERYEVTFDEGIYSETGYFAGDDNRRLQELITALTDPSVVAIVCARGGYGATRLLPNLDVELVSSVNKTLVGFSDVTALHSLWARAGVRSIHAPMVAAIGNASGEVQDKWIAALENTGESPEKLYPLNPISNPAVASVKGRLFGGNLAVLGALNGTPFVPPLDDGGILFLEDVGERPYRIDRMLNTLGQAGWFKSLDGVVLGSFSEGDPGPDGVSVEDVFRDHFGDLEIPVLHGLSAGHISENEPLTFGAEARIDGSTLSL